MTPTRKSLFLMAAWGFGLCACNGEGAPLSSESEAGPEKTAEASPELQGPNFCHGSDYNPKDSFRFVKFDFKIPQDEMKRIRASFKTELEVLNDLPQAEQAAAIEPYLAKTEILADLAVQSLEDQIVPAAAALCNFELFENNKCKAPSSRSVRKAEKVAGTLSYRAPVGRGREAQIFVSSRDFNDLSIDAGQATSTWSRAPDGVERFTFKDTISDKSWTEYPDCSGQMSKRRNAVYYELKWTPPKTQPLKMIYRHCRGEACISGEF